MTSSRWQCHEYLTYWADRYIANSDALQLDLVRNGYPAVRVFRLYNSVDKELFDVCHEKHEGGPRIGILGRISAEKGHEKLFVALRRLRNLAWLCRVFGKDEERGKYRQRLVAMIQDQEMEDRVEWCGYDEDLKRVLGGIDILAMPSVMESFGRVAAEAMASGIPVVAFSVGGLKEVIVHGETGLLVPLGDVGGLADALRRLIEDPVLRREMGVKGRERARKLFEIDAHVSGLMNVYTQVIRVRSKV
jgi:glycosyltransferase involved in cell wall biosynthesis